MTAAPAPVPASTYADAWPVYRALGWHGTIPLPRREKSPPPRDTTGWHAPMPSGADCMAWSDDEYRGTTQLALRLPDGVVGIDVDAYGTKVGGQTIAEAARQWGPLPDGPWSSARDDGVSGIRFYRVPAGTVLATVIRFEGIEDEQRLGGVEIIQHHHRYAVVWPSTNPKVNDAPYTWRNTGGPGPAPDIDDLPPLPDTWVEGLKAQSQRAAHQGTRTEANELLRGMPDGDCPTMTTIVTRAVDELRSGSASRHDTALAAVLRVIRAGERGHKGALTALGDLQRAFVAAVTTGPEPRSADVADAEFERMVYGPNGVGLVLSTPTASTDYGCRHGQQPQPRGIRLAAVDGKLVVDNGHLHDQDEEPPAVGSLNLPADFWDQRDSLKHIRAAAEHGWGCNDAVLAAMLARQSSYMGPDDTVDIGLGPGPLNLFAILYGSSSAGKGVSAKIAKRTLPKPAYLDGCDHAPHPRWKERPLGSGEGLVDSYFGMVDEPQELDEAKTRRVKRQVRRSCLFHVDEGEAFIRKAQRNGTTAAQVIRSAWSGAILGDANATAERDRQLDEGAYAIGMTFLFQPDTIGPLFDAQEVGGGTPQRFLFAAADDDTLPEEPPDDDLPDPGALPVASRGAPTVGVDGVKRVTGNWQTRPLEFRLTDPEIRHEVRRARQAGRRRDHTIGDLDGKRNEMRGRVAAILAWWDGGRTDVTADDWRIAGQVLDVSDAVRNDAISHGARKVREQRVAEDTRYVLREQAAHAAVLAVEEQRHESKVHTAAAILARKVVKVCHEEGADHVPAKGVRDAGGKKYRAELAEAIEWALDAEWLTVEDGPRNARMFRPGPRHHDIRCK